MAYTDIDKPSDYFNTKLYTGDGSTRSITSVGFQPDWTWIKYRNSGTYGHDLYDAVRGAKQVLNTNSTNAEYRELDRLIAFTSDGFNLGDAASVNENNGTYVAWNWKAGTSFTNDASSTGIGSIDSAGSASDTSGFSIVSYTGTGSNATVKHGLSTAPKMYIVKRRSNTGNWYIYHESIGNTKRLRLDETSAAATESAAWNNTSPTSSVFSIGTSVDVNGSSETYIAYCFAEKQGYSKFGAYTGNGNAADGTFVYTGFKPAFVMVKNTVNNSRNWTIIDNKRNSFNPENEWLYANATDSTFDASEFPTDFVSNGFKIRNAGSYFNTSGENYIYMAFAENPFVTSTGVPATAR